MNIFQIDEAITNCIDMETGEVIDLARLEELQMERDQKIENVALWIKNLVAESEALQKEMQTMRSRKTANDNKVESLKKYLGMALDGHKFKTPKTAVSFRKSTAVTVTDINRIPVEFLKFSEPKADKTAIKEAINKGVQVDGAELMENVSVIVR